MKPILYNNIMLTYQYKQRMFGAHRTETKKERGFYYGEKE